MWKPKVFVGSSSEAKEVVGAFRKTLKGVATIIPWWDSPEFEAMESTLEGLIRACNFYDFGLFIMTPDDKIESRGEKQSSARDNVLFEMGLFLGKLGPERVFVFIQESDNEETKVKMPSDLAGIVIPRFSNFNDYDLIASVGAAASEYGKTIQFRGPRFGRVKLVKSYGFDTSTFIFCMTLDHTKVRNSLSMIKDNRLIIVARKYDNSVAAEDDTNIAIGEPRRIPKLDNEDTILQVDGSNTFTNLRKGDRIDAYLLLLPEKYDLKKTTSLSQMLEDGCDILDRYGHSVGPIRSNKSKTKATSDVKETKQ